MMNRTVYRTYILYRLTYYGCSINILVGSGTLAFGSMTSLNPPHLSNLVYTKAPHCLQFSFYASVAVFFFFFGSIDLFSEICSCLLNDVTRA